MGRGREEAQGRSCSVVVGRQRVELSECGVDDGDHGTDRAQGLADGCVGCEEALGDRYSRWVRDLVPTGEDVDGFAVAFAAFGEGLEVLCEVVDRGEGSFQGIGGRGVEGGLFVQIPLGFRL